MVYCIVNGPWVHAIIAIGTVTPIPSESVFLLFFDIWTSSTLALKCLCVWRMRPSRNVDVFRVVWALGLFRDGARGNSVLVERRSLVVWHVEGSDDGFDCELRLKRVDELELDRYSENAHSCEVKVSQG